MQLNKRFFRGVVGYIASLLLANFLIWTVWTEKIISPNYEGGDLTRLGFIAGIKKIRKTKVDLPIRHLEMRDYHGEKVDVITIGDSFSIGGGEGENKYYQDYIASNTKLSVLNIPTYRFSTMICGAMPVATLSVMYHSGYLEKIKPQYVLLETVERYAIPRLVTSFDFNQNASLEVLERYYQSLPTEAKINSDVTFINEANIKFLYYSLMYQFSEHAFRRLVVKTKLNKTCFSGRKGDLLLFHADDIQQSPLATPENIKIANENLNYIARLLKKQGITLVFMPVVDKLNLYRPFIKNKIYPHSVFFEELRKLPKEYVFIDTKQILSSALEKGELNIFHQDDTHWTWRASALIFSDARFFSTANKPNIGSLSN